MARITRIGATDRDNEGNNSNGSYSNNNNGLPTQRHVGAERTNRARNSGIRP